MATETTKKTKKEAPDSPRNKRKAEIEELEVDVEAPEPPSKRARRALKKGKTLPPKQDSDDEREAAKTAKKEEKEATKAAARAEHSVWVGNLPFTVTADDLRKWLVDNSGGAITAEGITRVHLPTQQLPGKKEKGNKGFAYVDFAEQTPKVAAVALSENWLGIRKLLIKDGKSFEGRPKKEANADAGSGVGAGAGGRDGAADAPTSRKVFVGNLSFQTTEDDVRANFDRCGEIEWVKTATFEDSGKCKGFGWVKFKEPEAAAWAVKGFVKIKEEIETEDDFVDSKKNKKKQGDSAGGGGDDEEEGGEGEEDEKEEKKFKMRKWWVNRIAGRNLKIELAEDDQTRYKKRFRNGAQKRTGDDNNRSRGGGGGGGEQAAEDQAEAKPKPTRSLRAQDDLTVARLMGTAAKPTGTKITFD